jgi:hypothetical protein
MWLWRNAPIVQQMEERDMSTLRNFAAAATILASAAVTAGAALASSSHLTDAEYIAAARCQGLYQAKTLGPADASGINALIRNEGATREPMVRDRADSARDDARQQADHASALMKTQYASERDGSCQVWAKNGGGSVVGSRETPANDCGAAPPPGAAAFF